MKKIEQKIFTDADFFKDDLTEEQIKELIKSTYKKQNELYEELNKIPLVAIPQLTYKIWRVSIDHKKLGKLTKWINKDSDPIDLSEGYISMLECSIIGVNPDDYTEKGNRKILYDEANDIYWKMDKKYDCIMDYWVNYILND